MIDLELTKQRILYQRSQEPVVSVWSIHVPGHSDFNLAKWLNMFGHIGYHAIIKCSFIVSFILRLCKVFN